MEDYKLTGWFAVWHCIQPFVATLIVFLSMNYKKWFRGDKIYINYKKWFLRNKCLTPGNYYASNTWWYFNAVFCCLPNVIVQIYIIIYILFCLCCFLPIPVFTSLYKLFLDVEFHRARGESNFMTKISHFEGKIKEHEDLGKF